MATILSGYTDLSTTEPAVDTNLPNDTRWLQEGSIARPEVINDIYGNLRDLADYAGVNINALTRGDKTAWRRIFLAFGGGLTHRLPVTSDYTYIPQNGPQPLLRGVNVGPNISTANKWASISADTDVVNGDVLYDTGGVNRSSGDNVVGTYAGIMSTGLWNINASGQATRRSVSGNNFNNQAVYLSPTSNSEGFAHCLIDDVHVSRRSRLKYIGRILLTAPTPNSVVVAFNTLNQSESRIYQPPKPAVQIIGEGSLSTSLLVVQDIRQFSAIGVEMAYRSQDNIRYQVLPPVIGSTFTFATELESISGSTTSITSNTSITVSGGSGLRRAWGYA